MKDIPKGSEVQTIFANKNNFCVSLANAIAGAKSLVSDATLTAVFAVAKTASSDEFVATVSNEHDQLIHMAFQGAFATDPVFGDKNYLESGDLANFVYPIIHQLIMKSGDNLASCSNPKSLHLLMDKIHPQGTPVAPTVSNNTASGSGASFFGSSNQPANQTPVTVDELANQAIEVSYNLVKEVAVRLKELNVSLEAINLAIEPLTHAFSRAHNSIEIGGTWVRQIMSEIYANAPRGEIETQIVEKVMSNTSLKSRLVNAKPSVRERGIMQAINSVIDEDPQLSEQEINMDVISKLAKWIADLYFVPVEQESIPAPSSM